MLSIALVVALTLALSRWLVEPVVTLTTPLLNLSWIGWALVAVLVWFFAGGSGPGSDADG